MRLRLDLVVLVLEDNVYGMIRWKQATDGFADSGMTFENPDFPAYANAFGAKGSRVTTVEGLAPALERAFREGGPLPIQSHKKHAEWSTLNGQAPKGDPLKSI